MTCGTSKLSLLSLFPLVLHSLHGYQIVLRRLRSLRTKALFRSWTPPTPMQMSSTSWTRRHSLVPLRSPPPRHIWPSETRTVPFIYYPLQTRKRCCLSTGSRESPSIGLIAPNHFRRSLGRTERTYVACRHLFPTDSFCSPLNVVGLPHYKHLLLSSWSNDFVPANMYFPPPPKIPAQILGSIKVNDTIAYASLPKELRGRRNVVATAPRKPNGRFRSGKSRYNDVGVVA